MLRTAKTYIVFIVLSMGLWAAIILLGEHALLGIPVILIIMFVYEMFGRPPTVAVDQASYYPIHRTNVLVIDVSITIRVHGRKGQISSVTLEIGNESFSPDINIAQIMTTETTFGNLTYVVPIDTSLKIGGVINCNINGNDCKSAVFKIVPKSVHVKKEEDEN